MKSGISILALVLMASTHISAQTLHDISHDTAIFDFKTPYKIQLDFKDQNVTGCGIKIDWGDGKTDRYRIGEGQEITSPYQILHQYETVGEKQVVLSGEIIFRGLNTNFPCQTDEKKWKVKPSFDVEIKEIKEKETQAKTQKDELSSHAKEQDDKNNIYRTSKSLNYSSIAKCVAPARSQDGYELAISLLQAYSRGGELASNKQLLESSITKQFCEKKSVSVDVEKLTLKETKFQFEKNGIEYLTYTAMDGFTEGSTIPAWATYAIIGEKKREAKSEQNAKKIDTSKFRYKSCEQFRKEFIKYKDDWTINHEIICTETNITESPYKVVVSFPGTNNRTHQFDYQSSNDTVLYTNQSGAKLTLNAKTFLDINENTDINASGKIKFSNLPSTQKATVCGKINSANNPAGWLKFDAAAGYEIVQIARNDGFEWVARRDGDSCMMIVSIEGVYKGNMLSKKISCEITEVEKNSKNGYSVTQLGIGGSNDKGCKAVR